MNAWLCFFYTARKARESLLWSDVFPSYDIWNSYRWHILTRPKCFFPSVEKASAAWLQTLRAGRSTCRSCNARRLLPQTRCLCYLVLSKMGQLQARSSSFFPCWSAIPPAGRVGFAFGYMCWLTGNEWALMGQAEPPMCANPSKFDCRHKSQIDAVGDQLVAPLPRCFFEMAEEKKISKEKVLLWLRRFAPSCRKAGQRTSASRSRGWESASWGRWTWWVHFFQLHFQFGFELERWFGTVWQRVRWKKADLKTESYHHSCCWWPKSYTSWG